MPWYAFLTISAVTNASRSETQIYTDLDNDYQDYGSYEDDDWEEDSQYTYKSRRIENAKRGAFQSKLNKILIVVLILLAILIYAIFKL